jgi:putative colanic acid biosynthesis UDP-glucose lipid carrier transferase
LKKRYSRYIVPLKVISDILIINLILYLVLDAEYVSASFITYIILFWLVTSSFFGFYKVQRFTGVPKILTLLVKQFLIFTLGYFAYFGLFREVDVSDNQFFILSLIFVSISILKFIWFILLKKYRSYGNNSRSTVILGFDDSVKHIIKIFKSKSNLGYRYLGFFSDDQYNSRKYLGKLNSFFEFSDLNNVDEIYCSLSSLTRDEIKRVNKFAIEKNIVLKLVPNSAELYSKNQSVEFYDDTIMVLNVNKLPFDFAENFYVKRTFDIFFSILACLFVLSWLMPILWVIVKLDSKGPLIFKQQREGINCRKFVCYKIRSMKLNDSADKVHATKNDARITKVGAFLRKTSMDELPQFFNVLFGDMSVVGPRPHLESLSLEYQRDVNDYLKRHIVKPGITGLAQISGYRGEVKRRADIKNRVRLDIFYIENWSFFLDIKIVIQTVLSVFKGDETAY